MGVVLRVKEQTLRHAIYFQWAAFLVFVGLVLLQSYALKWTITGLLRGDTANVPVVVFNAAMIFVVGIINGWYAWAEIAAMYVHMRTGWSRGVVVFFNILEAVNRVVRVDIIVENMSPEEIDAGEWRITGRCCRCCICCCNYGLACGVWTVVLSALLCCVALPLIIWQPIFIPFYTIYQHINAVRIGSV